MILLLDVIIINFGQDTLNVTINLILYILLAAFVGLAAEYVLGWRVPFGMLGSVLVALIGLWVMTNVIIIDGLGDITLYGIPLLRSFIGALLLVAVVHYIRQTIESIEKRK